MQPRPLPIVIRAITSQTHPQYVLGAFTPVLRTVHLWFHPSRQMLMAGPYTPDVLLEIMDCPTPEKKNHEKRKKKKKCGWSMVVGRGKEGRMEIRIEPERALCLMLATFALEWRSNYPLVFGASVPRSQQPLGPCRHWASRASCLPNTCRYTGWANSPTTREPDERAGNRCQKPWKDLCKDRREV